MKTTPRRAWTLALPATLLLAALAGCESTKLTEMGAPVESRTALSAGGGAAAAGGGTAGHTDERGGREYNLALGQKRAEAVVRSLELLGAGAQQLEAVSFGEERPAVQGSDEAAWARNRRAELKDR